MNKKAFFTYIKIILCAVLVAFNYQLFIVANGFAPAGLNGVATMVQYKTGFSIGYMSLLINIPLCTFAFFMVRRRFALRSLCFCLVYSGTFLVLQNANLEAFQYVTAGHDTIYPVILSGIVSGLVYGVCFKTDASTGGIDIIAKYINLKKPKLNFFWVTFSLNSIVATVSFFVYAKQDALGNIIYDYKPVCLCMLYCFISAFLGDYIIKGTKTACEFTIVTSHADEISAEIYSVLKHSCTKISGIGGFTSNEKTVLLCVVNKHQVFDFNMILNKYDDTFAFSKTINETYGNFRNVK